MGMDRGGTRSGSGDFTVELRRRLAQRARALEELPRGMRKAIAALSMIGVTFFSVGGGIFVMAVLLHAIVQRVDLPPGMIYPSSNAAVVRIRKETHQYPVVALPRTTFSQAADHAVLRVGNPADPFIQADAVDFGVLLTREVHTLLTNAFHEAVSRPGPSVISPPRTPLTGGE